MISIGILALVPTFTAFSMNYLFPPPPNYETGKEFLKILLEISGILFGIGGIFATFLLKNAYDVREIFRNRESDANYNRTISDINDLISTLNAIFAFFLLSAVFSVIFSFEAMLSMDISPARIGICFGLVIGSFVILFIAFMYQNSVIEDIGSHID